MPLSPGTRLGPYEIVAAIGSGGMGEVYRGRDTRLDRVVAIKILPDHISSKPQARERFEREARAVSSLNHPHIRTLHAFAYSIKAVGERSHPVNKYMESCWHYTAPRWLCIAIIVTAR
jgi:serine/threonine protein kinase